MKRYYLAIDIGGTFIKYALVNDRYEIKKRWKEKSIKYDTKEEFYDYICSNVDDINLIKGIGVSAPGIIDKDSKVRSYVAPNVNIIYGTNINHEIEMRLGKKTRTINDAKAAGLCETIKGNAKHALLSAFLIIGTGTGGCVCSNKSIVFGRDGAAGEFHKLPFINYKNSKIDCMGDYSSMTGLINIYKRGMEENSEEIYGKEICDKYLAGEEKAIKAVDEWINNIAVQLLTITVFYNPDVICIGGGISEEDWFIDKLRRVYKKLCIKHMEADVITTEITRCKYNNDANLIGAVLHLCKDR